MTDFPSPNRAAYPVIIPMTTRWNDNDVYGHMNNVIYYEYFDSAVNQWLSESGTLPVPGGDLIGLVAETGCKYLHGVGYPEPLEIGLSTLRIGRSSVTYGLAMFKKGSCEAAAVCRFVHVYVGATSRRPEPLPDQMRENLTKIAIKPKIIAPNASLLSLSPR
ncbi:MAG: acyl-CoA thioesterase [Pikeienuella sp.]